MNTDAIAYYKLVIATFEKRIKVRGDNWWDFGSLRKWEKKLYDEAKRLLKEAKQ